MSFPVWDACVWCGVQVFLARCDATAFNLSMLTSDLWGVIVGFVLFHQSLIWLYFIALVVVVVGIIVYHRTGFASEGPVVAAADVANGASVNSEQELDTTTLLT